MSDENSAGSGDAVNLSQSFGSRSHSSQSAGQDLTSLCQAVRDQLDRAEADGATETLQRLNDLATELSDALEAAPHDLTALDGYKVLSSALAALRARSPAVEKVTRIERTVHVKSEANAQLLEYQAQAEKALADVKAMFSLPSSTTVQSLAFELKGVKEHMDLGDEMNTKVAKLTEENVNLRLNCRTLEEDVRQLKECQVAQDEQIIELRRERDELKEEMARREMVAMGASVSPEVKRAKLRIDEMSARVEKMKAKNERMKVALQTRDVQLSDLQRSSESLKVLNQKLALEVDDLKAKLSDDSDAESNKRELESKDVQIASLQDALGQLAEQMSEQTDEIAECNVQKNVLMTTLGSQRALVDKMERLLTGNAEEIAQQKREIQQLKRNLEKKDLEKVEAMEVIDDTIGMLRDFAINNMTEERARDVSDILDQGDSASIVSAFAYVYKLFLNARNEDIQEMCGVIGEQNERLFGYLHSQNDLLLSISGDESVHTDLRKEILQACAGIDAYLHENAPGLVEEFNVFNAFGMSVQPTEMVQLLTRFFKHFDEKLSPDGMELMAILKHAVAMNLILKKFDSILKDQCEYQANEITRMTNELTDLRELATYENEATIADLTNEITELKNELEEVRARSVQLQQEPKVKIVKREGAKPCDLELEQEMAKFQKVQRKLKKKLLEKQSELASVTERAEKLHRRISDLVDSNKDLESQNTLFQKQIEELNTVIKLQKEKNDELSQELKVNVESVKAELEEVKYDYTEKIKSQDRAWNVEVQKLKDQHKERLSKVQNEALVLNERIETLKSHYNQMISDLKEKVSEARIAERAANDKVRQAELDLKEVKSAMSQLNIDNKMLKLKMDSIREKCKRDQIQASNQVRARQISIVSELEDQANTLKTQHEREIHTLLASICDRFRDFIDFDKPITREHVETILDKVADSCSNSLDFERRLQASQVELDKLRTILKVKNKISIASAVDHLLSENERLTTQNKKLQTEIDDYGASIIAARSANNQAKEVKEWSQWARRLLSLTSSALQVGRSDKQVRQSLEEFLLSSLATRCNISWKLDSLRLQKSLLTSDHLPIIQLSSRNPTSIRPVLVVFAALHRMQKLSGHLHPTLSLACAEAPQPPLQRKWPLFTPA